MEILHKPTDYLGVASEFGIRQLNSDPAPRLHGGMDLLAPEFKQVYSAVNGIVLRAGWSNSMGNFIVIKDNVSGQGIIYMHLSQINLGKYGSFGVKVSKVDSTYTYEECQQTIIDEEIKGGINNIIVNKKTQTKPCIEGNNINQLKVA